MQKMKHQELVVLQVTIFLIETISSLQSHSGFNIDLGWF